jgi:DNA-binding CsgD family transcriptional regulator
VLTYLRDDFSATDPAWLRMRHVDPRPLRMQDTPYDFFSGRSYLEVLGPAGYKEGLTMCLFGSSGRYTGALHLNVENRRELSPKGRDMLHAVQTPLADMVNQLHAPEALARTLDPGCAAAVLVHGQWLQLEGRPLEPFNGVDGERLAASVAAALDTRIREGRFLWQSHESSELKSIYFVECGAAALVAIYPGVPEHPFTLREIEVLSHIANGLSNREIARALSRSERTITTHVEHIMKKLDAASRVQVATYALRHGLALIDEGWAR